MFSEKTSMLLTQIARFERAKKSVLCIAYAKDNRYSNEEVISSHDGKLHPATKVAKDGLLNTNTDKYSIIAIDEAQFFDNLREFVDREFKKGKIVLMAALNSTYQAKMFPTIVDVLPICTKIELKKSICDNCGNDNAIHSKKLDTENDTGVIEQIGGSDLYQAACPNCLYS